MLNPAREDKKELLHCKRPNHLSVQATRAIINTSAQSQSISMVWHVVVIQISRPSVF